MGPRQRCFALMAAEQRSPGDVEFGQHLGAQPLEPVPKELASPMELQIASALGLSDRPCIQRLPTGIEQCSARGGGCFWQWLARAALEEVAGVQLGHLDLPGMVASLRDEVSELRRQARARAEELARSKEVSRCLEAEALEGRAARRQLERAESDNRELREAHEGLLRTLAELQDEARTSVEERLHLEDELESAHERAEDAETVLEKIESKLDMARLRFEQVEESCVEERQLLHLERAENLRVRQDALEIALLASKKKKKKRVAKSSPSRIRFGGPASFTLMARRR